MMYRLLATRSLGHAAVRCKACFRPNCRYNALQFSTTNDNSDNGKKMSVKERLSDLWKKYGYTFVGTYIGLYGLTVGGLYFALDSDIMSAASFGLDAATATTNVCNFATNTLGITTFPEYVKAHPQIGTLVIAWVMTEFTEPIRLAAAVVIVPPLAKALGVSAQKNSRPKDPTQKSNLKPDEFQ